MPSFHSKPAIDNSKNAQTQPGKHADLKTGAAPKATKSGK